MKLEEIREKYGSVVQSIPNWEDFSTLSLIERHISELDDRELKQKFRLSYSQITQNHDFKEGE